MIKFLKGYHQDNQRINEWEVDGKLIKTTFNGSVIELIEGKVSDERLKNMQQIVDDSVRNSEIQHGA